jgi:hypothetical protein
LAPGGGFARPLAALLLGGGLGGGAALGLGFRRGGRGRVYGDARALAARRRRHSYT